jgi:hypothetical protein
MVTVLEECTTEKQRSVVLFMGKRTQYEEYSQRNVPCLGWEVFVA